MPDLAPMCDEGAEVAILATVMLQPDRLAEVQLLEPRHLFADKHVQIFKAVRSLAEDERAIDPTSVATTLREAGHLDRIGGTPYIHVLLDAPYVANLGEHAKIIIDLARRRRLASDAETLAIRIREGAPSEIIVERVEALQRTLPARKEALPIMGAVEIFSALPPVPYLCQGIDLCPGAPTILAGYGFSGKTAAAQSLAISVATAQPAWGLFPVRQGKVMHIDYEQGSRLTRERYQRLAAGMMVAPPDLNDQLFLSCMPPTFLDSPQAEGVLSKALEGFTLAIFDSLKAAAPSVEENSSDARRALDMLGRISEKTGCSMLVIHHARKPSDSSTGGARMALRGSSAIFDACSSVLVFNSTEKNAPISVSHQKARTSGVLADDFELVIDDFEVDGNKRAGLVVDAKAIATPLEPIDRLNALKERIIEVVREEGTISGKATLRDRLKCNKGQLTEAVKELIDDKLLVNSGINSHFKLQLPEGSK